MVQYSLDGPVHSKLTNTFYMGQVQFAQMVQLGQSVQSVQLVQSGYCIKTL